MKLTTPTDYTKLECQHIQFSPMLPMMNLPASLSDPLLIGLSYLIGSIPFAVVVSLFFGLQDPRSYGSGNPGATNVLRSGNKSAAALTLIGDAAKGWFAIWAGIKLGASGHLLAAITLAVFLGHLYPVFLKFKGGKGVATALGVMIAIQPMLALASAATWIIIVVCFKYSSLGAIVCAIFAPVFYFFGGMIGVWNAQTPITIVLAVIGLLLLYRHRANISRLIAGTEPRVGKKS
jgi:glycerol-3-phosphate acyltransferase PlsY